jgi:hypothetical protein
MNVRDEKMSTLSSLRALAPAFLAVLAAPSGAWSADAGTENRPRTAARPTAAGEPNLDWLVGKWKQPSLVPRWMELTWTATPGGFHGLLERVDAGGARATLATYVVETRGVVVTLAWQHRPDEKATPTTPDAELTRLLEPDHSGGAPPARAHRAGTRKDTFRGSFSPGQGFEVAWDAAASDPGTRTKGDPELLQFSLEQGRLIVAERRVRRRFVGGWRQAEFVRLPSEGPPAVAH